LQVRLLPVTSRLRSSIRQSSRLLPGDVQVRPLPGPSRGRTAMGAVPRLENGWASRPWGFDSLSFRLHGGMAELERQRVASAQAAPPLAGSSPAASVFVAMSFKRQDGRLLPDRCWFEPSRRSSCPGRPAARMPAPQAGDAGSSPARGVHALGRVWRCGPAVSRVRRVRSPSRALLAVAQRTSTRLLPWPTGVRLLPARLRRKASSEPAGREPVEQGAIPWRRPNNDDGPAGQAPL
jgi:hypothetical protein